MLTFNNNHIFTGFLKQLLHSFNLPKYRVYTIKNANYYYENRKEKDIIETILKNDETTPDIHTRYVSYIKDGFIQRYINGKWIINKDRPYVYNEPYLNQTKTLPIKNNVYDTETHEYLGEFLRFQRDYNNLDLMPLYNCFSDRICNQLKIKFNSENISTGRDTQQRPISFIESVSEVSFDTHDKKYKIYMVPVKLFNEYTIAIDCNVPVEMCCGIYGKYQDTRAKFSKIPYWTYQKFNSLTFNQPILYSKLLSSELLKKIQDEANLKESELEIAQNENDLKLFIKLPINNQSTITILEGNYIGWNDRSYKRVNDSYRVSQNRFITNFEDWDEDHLFQPISSLELLRLNTKVSHPFSDRLIEYLVGNTITNQETLEDNINRAIAVIQLNHPNETFIPGEFTNKIRPLVYDFMMDLYERPNFNNLTKATADSLGYIDKDVEKYYTYKDPENGISVSIANVDIYNNK